MSSQKSSSQQNPSDKNAQRDLGGWGLSDILRDITITWQLMGDPGVSMLLKLCLPLFALFDRLSPVDLLIGLPFDDLAVIVLASRLFVQMAPADAVERALIRMGRMKARPATEKAPSDQPDRDVWDIWDDDPKTNTINGQWRVVDE